MSSRTWSMPSRSRSERTVARLMQADEYRFGKRGVLRKGDQFRAQGGPVYVGRDGRPRRIGRPGVYKFICCLIHRTRIWLQARSVKCGSCETLYVKGPKFRSPNCPGVVNRPYRIALVRKEVRSGPGDP